MDLHGPPIAYQGEGIAETRLIFIPIPHFLSPCHFAPLYSLQIHEHILIHGDIRKKTTLQVAGETVEIEQYVEDEDEVGVFPRDFVS